MRGVPLSNSATVISIEVSIIVGRNAFGNANRIVAFSPSVSAVAYASKSLEIDRGIETKPRREKEKRRKN
jgi:hypothetical protein